MNSINTKETEFRTLMDNFAKLIRILVSQYQLYKYGLDPDDVVQDVKIKIWELVRSDKKIVSYSSYIKKIVSSSVIDQLRKFRRDKGVYNHEIQIRIAEVGLAYNTNTVHLNSLEDTIGRAVELLIDTRRQVVKLYLLNLSIKEIADYLNWSEDKTRNLLYRGLNDLKKILKDMDIQYENGNR